jgi:hypothetical protein
MDVKSYCDSVGGELIGWKAKLYDVIRKADSLGNPEKKKIAPMVQALNGIVDDLNARLELLVRECPADWGPEKAAIEAQISRMKGQWKEVWGAMGEPEYGIGGA